LSAANAALDAAALTELWPPSPGNRGSDCAEETAASGPATTIVAAKSSAQTSLDVRLLWERRAIFFVVLVWVGLKEGKLEWKREKEKVVPESFASSSFFYFHFFLRNQRDNATWIPINFSFLSLRSGNVSKR